MAKTVSRKVNKKIKVKSLEVKTPYPEKEKQKSDDNHWGEKMVKLQDRVNELELAINEMHAKLKVVAGRMGL